MKWRPEDIFAFTSSLGLHLVLGALLWFGLPDFGANRTPEVIPVQAVFLDQSRSMLAQEREAEAARKRAEEEARRRAAEEKRKAEEAARRKAEEEARKKAEAEAKRKAEEEARRQAEAKRKAEAEAQRKAEAEAKRKAEEAARKKAEEEARRKAAEEARKRRQAETEQRLKEALAAEEAALRAEQEAAEQARRDATDREDYVGRITRHIESRWRRPPGFDQDFSCDIRIQQLPGGQIQSYELLESCGNSFLDTSVEKAIRESDPLPLPDNRRVFDRNITFTFKPKK